MSIFQAPGRFKRNGSQPCLRAPDQGFNRQLSTPVRLLQIQSEVRLWLWSRGLYTGVRVTPRGIVFLQISILIILFLFQVDAAKVVTHFEGNGQVGNCAAISGEDGSGQGKRWEELTRTFENPSNFRSVLNGPLVPRQQYLKASCSSFLSAAGNFLSILGLFVEFEIVLSNARLMANTS